MPTSRSRAIRLRETSEGLRKLLRKARRDAWEDCVRQARALGYIDHAQADDLKARDPHGGCW